MKERKTASRNLLIPEMSNCVKRKITALDLYSGAGGSSCGARMAGVEVVAAVDSWGLACKTYQDNVPATRLYQRKCENLKLSQVRRDVGPISLLIASPECTSHSCAKGNGARSESSRMTAMQVIKFAESLKPRWIVVENVIQMRYWNRYKEWIARLKKLGYKIEERVLDAADFGVPQSRRRLFILCDRKGKPPQMSRSGKRKIRPARSIIDVNGTYTYSALYDSRRAKATLVRARRAVATLGRRTPFLLVYYGSDGPGGWQRLSVPLRTITTLDRFAYVRRKNGRHEMRMLQVPELKKAMGFPENFKLKHGTRRDQIHLMGNAVCPPVMRAIVTALTKRVGQNVDQLSTSKDLSEYSE